MKSVRATQYLTGADQLTSVIIETLQFLYANALSDMARPSPRIDHIAYDTASGTIANAKVTKKWTI